MPYGVPHTLWPTFYMSAFALVCRKGLRSLVADFLPRARLDALELLREEELTAERDAGAGGCLYVWDVQSYVL